MIRKNLFLLEYMVINRIEKDTLRLEALKSVGKLLEQGELDLDNIKLDNVSGLVSELSLIKGRSLSFSEKELVEEIILITKSINGYNSK